MRGLAGAAMSQSQQQDGQDGPAPRHDMRWAYDARGTARAWMMPWWWVAGVLATAGGLAMAVLGGRVPWFVVAGGAVALVAVAGVTWRRGDASGGGRRVAWLDAGRGLVLARDGLSARVLAGWTCDHLPEGIGDRAYQLVQGAFATGGVDVTVHASKDVAPGVPGYAWVVAIGARVRGLDRAGLASASARVQAAGSRLWTGTAFPHHRFVPASPAMLARVALGW